MTHNAKQPNHDSRFERHPVKCGRCKKVFGNFIFETIDGLVQLRDGNALVLRAEISCVNCGAIFSWTVRDRDIEKMATYYEKLLKQDGYLAGNKPE